MFLLKAQPQTLVTVVLLVQALIIQCHDDHSTTSYIDTEDDYSTTGATTVSFNRCELKVELTEATGQFWSSRYPADYHNNEDCSWHITVKSGSRVELHVQIDSIENSANCNADAILVYDGADASAPLLAKECGEDKNITLLSTGNEMFVEFLSDSDVKEKGFIANYVTIRPAAPEQGMKQKQFIMPQLSPNWYLGVQLNGVDVTGKMGAD